eukprot:CAMPEP_0184679640 /NCGR_PEP_ID=MMETSP0312-20130426/2477_1 /TAXON_ID=31354 /ORGANISM="Compsopogon coeruleus, Strain SAG 36.94" /LENGTH=362 /DNA_ID=CAMNT_0027129207 /DNA_START=153 /DNA_END=1238 /DNA_ORIENTATION=+
MVFSLRGGQLPKQWELRRVREFLLYRCDEDKRREEKWAEEEGHVDGECKVEGDTGDLPTQQRRQVGVDSGEVGKNTSTSGSVPTSGRSFVRDHFPDVLEENDRVISDVLVHAVVTGRKVQLPSPSKSSNVGMPATPRFVDVTLPGLEEREMMNDGLSRNDSTSFKRDIMRLNHDDATPATLASRQSGTASFAPHGERFHVAMFPEIFLDDERRIIAGTCIECRSISGIRLDSSMVTGWTEGRFVADLDHPWEELRSYRRSPGTISLTISHGTPAGVTDMAVVLLREHDEQETWDLSAHVLGETSVQIACQFCNERKTVCECSTMMRRRLLPEGPESFPDWSSFISIHRCMPPTPSVSALKVW